MAVCGLGALAVVGAASAVVGTHPVPSVGADARVSAVAFSTDHTRVFLGGAFSTVGTAARSGLASVNVSDGTVTAWNPNPNNNVKVITVSGSTVFVGGNFTRLGTTPAGRLAAIDANTGAILWTAKLNRQVNALDVANGVLYAGGYFTTANGQPRNYLAAFDAGTGALSSTWTPSADLEVKTIQVEPGGGPVVVGGDFSTINGANTPHLTALSPTTGAGVAWHSHPSYPVISMWADATGIYVAAGGGGGNFAKFDDGGNQVWQGGTNGNVQAVTEFGGVAYFGGHWQTYCGPQSGQHTCTNPIPREHMLAVDATTGSLLSWNAAANSALGVFAMAGNRSTLAIGGDFTTTGGRAQPHFAMYQ